MSVNECGVYRYYLYLSGGLDDVMEDWEIAQTGGAAYRHGATRSCSPNQLRIIGFCLPKIIYIYGPVWETTAAINTFVLPTTFMLQDTPHYQKFAAWVRRLFRLEVQPQDLMEDQIQLVQSRIAGQLAFITVGIAFGVTLSLLG